MTEPQLPQPPTPQGSYLPAIVHDGLAFTAGMTPRIDGTLVYVGIVGPDVSITDASEAAALAAANALSAIAYATGGLQHVTRCLRMTVYIACRSEFIQHSAVADGASAALRTMLGDRGAVARTAVGVSSLPSGSPVEVEVVAAVVG